MRVAQLTFRSQNAQRRARRETEAAHLQEKHPAIVAKRLALAYRIQGEIDEGLYEDMADVALTHDLSRARLTQIMNLLFLAPDIQEEILALEYPPGRQPITERMLRCILKSLDWAEQRVVWAGLKLNEPLTP